ncbi:hypothetical protein HMPREF0682_0542 [Propionibacterium acidifaciens F0233]|uniref:Uncharacterized protein n=1 Tax=Propionibacterium acidifaciens F0233 TaxID=553198 RepID=U2SA31_9ACTN|nr:hypothetical protein [Propionibacterium acidifaciens]AYW77784.1 hypothetical protein EGX94_06580 [Propionibacterium acidifaciens]ERK62453.1 hypothetical protein HMPREF0682_0542 [Propionibacterium acidifaciens F0233]
MANTPEGCRTGADAAPCSAGTASAESDGGRRGPSLGARVALVLVGLLVGLPVLGIGAGAVFLAVQAARMQAYDDARAAQAQRTVLDYCARTYGFTPEITGREGRSTVNGADTIGHIGTPRDDVVTFEAAHDGTAFQIEADYADTSDPYKLPEGPIDATVDRLRDNYQADEVLAGVYAEVAAVLGLPTPVSTNAATIKRREMLTDVHYDGTNAREVFGTTEAGALETLGMLYGADVDLDGAWPRAGDLLPEGTGGGRPVEFWCDIYQLRAGADPAQWDWTRDPEDQYPIVSRVLGISAPLSTTFRPEEQGVGTTYITDSQLAYWESTHFIALFAPVTPSELPGDLDWSETARLTGGTSHDPVGTVHRVSTSESERMSGQWVGPADDTVYIPASLIDDYLGQGYRDAAMLIFDPSVEVGTPYDVESPVRCGDYYVIDRPFHKGEYFTLALAR